MELDIEAILRERRHGKTPKGAATKARKLEQSRRNGLAGSWASSALAHLHPDEHAELYRQALDKINAERGPLPD